LALVVRIDAADVIEPAQKYFPWWRVNLHFDVLLTEISAWTIDWSGGVAVFGLARQPRPEFAFNHLFNAAHEFFINICKGRLKSAAPLTCVSLSPTVGNWLL